MLLRIKRLFRRTPTAMADPGRIVDPEPKLSCGTASGQPVVAQESVAPTAPFRLFDGPEALRPRQIDHSRVHHLSERLLAELAHTDVVLPPSPVMALRVSVFLKKGDLDTNELVRLIGQDPSITAKVLQVANSALYGPAMEIDSVRGAVMQMGTRSVSTLVLAEATRSMFDPGTRTMPDSYRQLAARLFHDAATTSNGAGALAMAVGRGRVDRVFLSGMLLDIGKPLALRLLGAFPLDRGPLEGDLLEAVLEEVHVETGRYLMQRWELPAALVAMCARHHDDEVAASPGADELHVLRVASGVVAHLRGVAPGELNGQVLHSMNALKITPAHARVLVNDCREHSRVVVSTYGVDSSHAFGTPASPTARGSQSRPFTVSR